MDTMTTLPYWDERAHAGNAREVVTIPIFLKRANPDIMQRFVFGNGKMGLEEHQSPAMGLTSLSDWIRFDFPDEDIARITGPANCPFPFRGLVTQTQSCGS